MSMCSQYQYLFLLAVSFPTVLSILSIMKIRNLEEILLTKTETVNDIDLEPVNDMDTRINALDKKIDLLSDELDEKLDLFHDDLVNAMKDFVENAE